MITIWLYSLLAVFLVSIVSFIGVLTLAVGEKKLQSLLMYLVSFSAGTLLADVFIHIFPEMAEVGFGVLEGFYVLFGIVIFFILERVILWHHDHSDHAHKTHSAGYLVVVGDGVHNFIDGVIIASSFLIDVHLGVTATLAVLAHELPHEIGDFAVLIHSGWDKFKALKYNFLSALTSVLGAVSVLVFSNFFSAAPSVLLAFGAASFIYIALSDLVPELHKERKVKQSVYQLLWLLAGVFMMAGLLFLE